MDVNLNVFLDSGGSVYCFSGVLDPRGNPRYYGEHVIGF